MKKLSELNLNELTSRRIMLKSCLIAFVVLGVLACLVLLFLKAKPVSFISVMVLPMTWLPLWISLKSINEEIKSRNAEKVSS
ncbi:hypothetical protein [Chryseolinea lacunae]|uniref:Redox-active disulfide protein 2 n=1 Tax=Chryseolinea lacunae TaxID=2801331 RepID=A0ABS1KMN3_9BACT|nr:hypothetical protein [Chryseolinea lacunae]MBL0740730.1 hypothetical protein [Chryseolinea lacunae]